MLGKKSIATLWRDAQEGTTPLPTYTELKSLLLKRRHDLNSKMYWWRKPAVDSLSSLDFADLIVLGKIDHYLAEGTEQPWYCFGDRPDIKEQVDARMRWEEGGPLWSEAGRCLERHANEIATFLIRHAQHIEEMRRAA